VSEERLTDGTGATVNPVRERDASALIGLLAVVEGFSLAGELAPDLEERLVRRLHRVGLLAHDQSSVAFRSALNGLNQRLRFALGEYPGDPTAAPIGE
jgi:hypothetical protein